VKFGLDFPLVGDFSDARSLAALAGTAEEAGWDGCFVWDHVLMGKPCDIADPWVVLGLIAFNTQRIQIGTLVTPVPRRHPWKLARETLTLHALSNGRLILGVGLGSDAFSEISSFAGPIDDSIRASILDEALFVLRGLWSGSSVLHKGKYFTVNSPSFLASSTTRPNIPIWVAGTWPRRGPLRRAAQYEGFVPVAGDMHNVLSPDQLRAAVAYIDNYRAEKHKLFDVVHLADIASSSVRMDRDQLQAYAAAGTTWWIETIPPKADIAEVKRRIRDGPPKDA
jgi:alkanesulfonate monooxygenase SsuD/methylene tetrahydromethanopterin reductase-like flavin-dependent oxidoreductase (luciferase family)